MMLLDVGRCRSGADTRAVKLCYGRGFSVGYTELICEVYVFYPGLDAVNNVPARTCAATG